MPRGSRWRCRRRRRSQAHRRTAGLGSNPFGEIRTIEQHHVAADRLEFDDQLFAPHDIDGLQPKRFCDSDQRAPDAGIGAVSNQPCSRLQGDEIGEKQIGGRRIDAEHRKLLDVAGGKRPQGARIHLDPLRPGGGRKRHQRPVTLFQMCDTGPNRDHMADAFGSDNARQLRPIAIAAGNH